MVVGFVVKARWTDVEAHGELKTVDGAPTANGQTTAKPR